MYKLTIVDIDKFPLVHTIFAMYVKMCDDMDTS